MAWYIIRRILQAVPVVLGATLLIYALVFLRPGDPIVALFGDKPVSEAVRAQIEAQYNFDKPFLVQWLLFLKGALTLDLGLSFSGQPVIDLIARAFPVTIKLAFMALVIESVLGIAAGFYAGIKRGKLFDSTMLVVSLLVIAVPIFVFGFLMQLVFGVKLAWAPVTVGGDASFTRLLIPAFVLGLVSFAYVLRLTRTSMIENLTADHVRTARAKGLTDGQVNRRHVLRNSLIPVVTYLGADLGTLMAGAIVTEGIFNVPGVGNLAWRAIQQGETPTIVSVVTVMVLIYVVMSLLVDLLYAWLDPRIRYA
ncbi:ABC transporter permease [Aeromicrobium flavum]|uniref:ABC transporter permease n=1 Tax=Aeromicrobium flavum TaxID=416568 RepID=A0A512HXG0_9ACTN|nr:ABC transporter permease [Aeromicrobium flavum]GEO90138.1 ABC transporter permease [Aeromicrobium flavum]